MHFHRLPFIQIWARNQTFSCRSRKSSKFPNFYLKWLLDVLVCLLQLVFLQLRFLTLTFFEVEPERALFFETSSSGNLTKLSLFSFRFRFFEHGIFRNFLGFWVKKITRKSVSLHFPESISETFFEIFWVSESKNYL